MYADWGVVVSNDMLVSHTAAFLDEWGMRTLQNVLHNMEDIRIRAPLHMLPRVNMPCVVVAAGPSLDKQLALLKQARDRVLVIAVTRSLAALDGAGIAPDITVCIDPRQACYEHLGQYLTGCMVVAAEVDPSVMAAGHYVFATCSLGQWACDHTVPAMQNSGNVAIACIRLANLIGCQDIAAIGLDMAYTDGRLYAQGCGDEPANMACEQGAFTAYRQLLSTLEVGWVNCTEANDLGRGQRFEAWLDGHKAGRVYPGGYMRGCAGGSVEAALRLKTECRRVAGRARRADGKKHHADAYYRYVQDAVLGGVLAADHMLRGNAGGRHWRYAVSVCSEVVRMVDEWKGGVR